MIHALATHPKTKMLGPNDFVLIDEQPQHGQPRATFRVSHRCPACREPVNPTSRSAGSEKLPTPTTIAAAAWKQKKESNIQMLSIPLMTSMARLLW